MEKQHCNRCGWEVQQDSFKESALIHDVWREELASYNKLLLARLDDPAITAEVKREILTIKLELGALSRTMNNLYQARMDLLKQKAG